MNEKNENTVKPYRSLFFLSMPCEYRAAAVSGNALRSMRQRDIAGVSYRFLQAREGAKNSLIEASAWTGLEIYLLLIARYSQTPAKVCLPMLLLVAANIPPNIGNHIRYRETKRSSQNWLTQNMEENHLNAIKSIPYTSEGLQALASHLENENIDTSSIKDKKVHTGTLRCWTS